VNANGSNDHSTGVLGESPNWSPDGTKIAFNVQLISIHVMKAEGTGETDITPDMPGANSPDWQRQTASSVGSVGPVGGLMEPVNKVAVFSPYLALFGLAVVTVVAAKPWKRREN